MSITNTKILAARMGITRDDGRPDHDFYETVPEAVYPLLAVEELEGTRVWEPACGRGAIVRLLQDAECKVAASDLYEYDVDFPAKFGVDFLTSKLPSNTQPLHIVTNPPFAQLREFAERGIHLLEYTHGKLALLARLSWLEGIGRMPMFQNSPLYKVWVFSRRIPMMHRPEHTGKKTSSMLSFAWFVWKYGYRGGPGLGWVDWKDYMPEDE